MAAQKKFMYGILKKIVFLPPISNDGALAQLARAFDWQSRGREFDSHTLHTIKHLRNRGCFFLYLSGVSFQ